MSPLAVQLKDLRTRSGLSYQRLADGAGLPVSVVEKIIKGKTRRPHLKTLSKLLMGFGLNGVEAEPFYVAAGWGE